MRDDLSIEEQERLLAGWSAATFKTPRENAESHYNKHAIDLSFWEYVQQAVEFPRDRAVLIVQSDRTIKYELRDRRFVIDRDGFVVTYGWNR